MKEYPPMRAIKVTFSNGEIMTTEMAYYLTDKEMLDYYAIGRSFNCGSYSDTKEDDIHHVIKAEILR